MFSILRSRRYKGPKPPTRIRCLCLCACGKKFFAWKQSLATGNTKSCGCLRNTRTGARSKKYDEAYSTRSHPLNWLYMRWTGMLERCTNPKSSNWKNYGGRGITVCERWMRFDNFLSDMGVPAFGLSIDRIDNDKGYEPSNCRWATPIEQRQNQRPRSKVPSKTQQKKLAQIQAFEEWASEFKKKYP